MRPHSDRWKTSRSKIGDSWYRGKNRQNLGSPHPKYRKLTIIQVAELRCEVQTQEVDDRIGPDLDQGQTPEVAHVSRSLASEIDESHRFTTSHCSMACSLSRSTRWRWWSVFTTCDFWYKNHTANVCKRFNCPRNPTQISPIKMTEIKMKFERSIQVNVRSPNESGVTNAR